MSAPSPIDPKPSAISWNHWMALVAAFLGWMFDGLEMGLFPLVARPALLELLGPENAKDVGPWFGLMIAGFLVGAASGGVLFGWLGDRIGRVRAMMFSVLTYSIFMGLCGFANTAESMFALRFISSLGMGGEWSLGVALVMEIWPNKTRGLLAGLIGAAANCGFLLIGIVGFGLANVINQMSGWLTTVGLPSPWVDYLVANSGWRLMMIFGAAPALLTLLIRLFVPESEKWLHGKSQGATSHWATRDLMGVAIGSMGPLVMIYLWAPNKDFSSGVRLAGSVVGLAVAILGYTYPVYRYLQRAGTANLGAEHQLGPTLRRMLLGACISGVALLGTWGSLQWAAPWADKLVEQSALDGKVYPDLEKARSEARAYTGIVTAIGAIIGTMLGALAGNAFGRRITYCSLCVGSLLSALFFFQFNQEFGPMFLVTAFLAGGITSSFYGWLPLYLPELFRTSVRATGQGFSFNFGRIIAAVGALQTGALMSLFKDDQEFAGMMFKGGYPLACTVMSSVYLVGMVLIWFVPETHGKDLPD